MIYCYNFFFQAEDGIRDLTVTGVQTCALPISVFSCRRANVRRMIDAQQIEFRSHPIPCAYACEYARIRSARAAPQPAQPSALQAPAHAGGAGIEPDRKSVV